MQLRQAALPLTACRGVRWLSRGNVMSRLYELRDEVHLCLMEHGTQLADHFTDPAWLTRLAYLSCTFEKLNGVNLALTKGQNTSILSMNDEICAFKTKLERWSARVKMGRLNMFSELDEFIEENALSVNSVKKSITAHLQSLLEHFNKYFPEETTPTHWLNCQVTEPYRQPLTPRCWRSFGFRSRGNTHSYPRPLCIYGYPLALLTCAKRLSQH